ncbi:DUF1272 domain-containing protein [Dyella sp. RRB7]|uniref:DUF1272 domain-containing protein n=1 Tax=Dyella sp. RRB7 TaxID=2919502 RepID=UPI001FAA321F|nr:DUF1272 domain-containing protein [Dyella sp. RRB7]
MLELRPTCEHCNTSLPPASTEAMICSFECTFCRDCVALLHNVCPHCGGGFAPRPVRPAHDWKHGNPLANHPATTKVTHNPVDLAAHAVLVAQLKHRSPAPR